MPNHRRRNQPAQWFPQPPGLPSGATNIEFGNFRRPVKHVPGRRRALEESRPGMAPAVEWEQYEGMNSPTADGRAQAQAGAVDYRACLHPWSRYVALGDSFTEGVGDPEPRSPGACGIWPTGSRPDAGPVFGARMPPGTFIGDGPRNYPGRPGTLVICNCLHNLR